MELILKQQCLITACSQVVQSKLGCSSSRDRVRQGFSVTDLLQGCTDHGQLRYFFAGLFPVARLSVSVPCEPYLHMSWPMHYKCACVEANFLSPCRLVRFLLDVLKMEANHANLYVPYYIWILECIVKSEESAVVTYLPYR